MKVLGEKGQELSNTQSDLKEAQVALLFPVRLSTAELDTYASTCQYLNVQPSTGC